MKTQIINYLVSGKTYQGYVAIPEGTGPFPLVLIAHAWRGQDDFARQKATELASLGIIGFAADVYGDGKSVETNEEATALMIPLFMDRHLLQERIKAAFFAAEKLPECDKKKMGIIGFCFGGLTAIELLRSGVPLRGAVSFHGLLGDSLGGHTAKTVPLAPNIKGSLLVLHGANDPLVSLEDITTFQKRFTEAKIDWQMYVYGDTSHAFTNPQANDPNGVLVYNPKSAKRAWQSMQNFFTEMFT